MKRWYEYEYELREGKVFAYDFSDQDMQRFKMGKEIHSPPVDWMQKMLKSNANRIKELLEENDSMANLLTEHYSESV
jgi:hypothetical protein